MNVRREFFIAVRAAFTMTSASAADCPVKPVKVITGFVAGGPGDISARITAPIGPGLAHSAVEQWDSAATDRRK